MQLEENFRELMGKGEVKIIKITNNEESRLALFALWGNEKEDKWEWIEKIKK